MRRAIDRGLTGRRPSPGARWGRGLPGCLGPTTQARGRSAESLTKRLQVVLSAPLQQNRLQELDHIQAKIDLQHNLVRDYIF